MPKEYACIVKRGFWLSTGFVSWCGRTYQTSRAADWFTSTCPACVTAKREGRNL
ncbi:MAG: hypothetical protein WBA97_24735 [Actinophytocola sp.]|uniref:hypothetical protein n=1 Tax=Actinophytocola sp. TaxID=1872138 RepID=UPI003C739914